MKLTPILAAAALSLAATAAHAAEMMDCCKDGKCACCKKDEEGKKDEAKRPA